MFNRATDFHRGALLFLAVTLQRLGVLDRMTQP